jgi:hypothetical protein
VAVLYRAATFIVHQTTATVPELELLNLYGMTVFKSLAQSSPYCPNKIAGTFYESSEYLTDPSRLAAQIRGVS